MRPEFTLFLTTFTTLLAIINPREALPIFLELLEGKTDPEHRRAALKSCLHATGLCFFWFSAPLSCENKKVFVWMSRRLCVNVNGYAMPFRRSCPC